MPTSYYKCDFCDQMFQATELYFTFHVEDHNRDYYETNRVYTACRDCGARYNKLLADGKEVRVDRQEKR